MLRTAIVLFILAILPLDALAAEVQSVRDDLSEKDQKRVIAVTTPTKDFTKPEAFEAKSGGAATSTFGISRDSFSHFSTNLTFAEEEKFKLGNALFRKLWVSSPSSTLASDGLGPLYNARACQSCHVKDGRGRAPDSSEEKPTSLFLRLSVPPKTAEERAKLANREWQSVPAPIYGGQLQNRAIPGHSAEGEMAVSYEEMPIPLSGGEIASLRKPTYTFINPAYGQPADDILLSPRIAPQMIGLGLMEQIHPADILINADPDDENGDNISGRPSWVRDADSDALVLGRFGLKASMPSIRAQSAGAFAGDIGISSPDVPMHAGDCTALQPDCLNAPNGVQEALGDSEAPDPVMELVTFYSQNLAVPARRNVGDPKVLKGKQLFYDIGCASCHTPKYVTRRDAPNKAQAFQLIWPYTDMLLHDMGEGLADHRPDGDADGYEWRTPPLWGIGLTEAVSGHTQFLHDGRARNLLEAILWHGGEAAAQQQAVVDLEPTDRQSLIAFLESL
jgi:CxxC motif-containing protein (DUF1111 family)